MIMAAEIDDRGAAQIFAEHVKKWSAGSAGYYKDSGGKYVTIGGLNAHQHNISGLLSSSSEFRGFRDALKNTTMAEPNNPEYRNGYDLGLGYLEKSKGQDSRVSF